MQEIYNAAWYAGNEEIKYPIDGEASGYSDEGDSLPTSLISDIRVVTTAKKTLRIAGVTCSEHLISVVIASGNDMIAALSVAQPVTPYTHYKMESFSGDSSAVIAFGHTDNYGKWRFSSPEQSKLAPTCQIVMNPWPVTSFADDLKGDLTLTAGPGIKIGVEERVIGKTRMGGTSLLSDQKRVRAIVIRGHVSTADAGIAKKADTMFLGKCATRPDNSDNQAGDQCRYILTLGGAVPDENGNIDIKVISEIPEFQVDTATETNGYVTTYCETELPACNTLVISGTQVREERPPMEFGKPGKDMCAEDEEQESEHTQPSPYVYRDLNLREATYPLEGEGLEYDNESGLTNTGDTPALASADIDCVYTFARFTIKDHGVCGFHWGDNKSFLYDGVNLTLNGQSFERILYGEITMEMELKSGVLTARLFRRDILLSSMTEPCDSLDRLSLYLLYDCCTQWRVG